MYLFLFVACDIFSFKEDFSGSWLMEFENGSSQCGLSTAGLSNHTQCLTLIDGQADPVYRM